VVPATEEQQIEELRVVELAGQFLPQLVTHVGRVMELVHQSDQETIPFPPTRIARPAVSQR
jgi:hypothetical protein